MLFAVSFSPTRLSRTNLFGVLGDVAFGTHSLTFFRLNSVSVRHLIS